MVLGLQQGDGLLELIQVLLQHEGVVETADEFGQVLDIFSQGEDTVGVKLLDFGGKRECLDMALAKLLSELQYRVCWLPVSFRQHGSEHQSK